MTLLVLGALITVLFIWLSGCPGIGTGPGGDVRYPEADLLACGMLSQQQHVKDSGVEESLGRFDVGIPSCSITHAEVGGDDNSAPPASDLTTTNNMIPQTICAVDGDVDLRGHAEVGSAIGALGGVHANGNVWLHGAVIANGEVTATGAVQVGGRATVGGVEGSVPPVSQPDIPISRYSREADEGLYWDGTYEVTGACCLGPLYVAGDLIVTNGAVVNLCGTVYVAGEIRLSGGCRIEGSGVLVAEGNITVCGELLLNDGNDQLVVSVYGDIRVTGRGYVAATLCALNGDVFLAGNCVVNGAVIGRNVTVGGNASVY